MSRSLIFFVVVVLASLVSVPEGIAGEILSVRLVEAHESATRGPSDPRLQDIEPAFRKQLPFSTYTLLDSKETRLPASGQLSLSGGLQVTCQGPQNNLSLVIRHHGKELVNSTVDLQNGKPLVLGGFAGERGKLLIVVLTQ